ncbi:MAG TPA: potassium transporter [Candidatus Tenderia electrophaga]|uniref:Potassium transporter n=1 Tax=Candidatus Tenderia electrophaga TaxID=1748243 RepID=A0A832N380_9GAMM|nr:potassium transporter [Candidatus Tenderia electrophaga]
MCFIEGQGYSTFMEHSYLNEILILFVVAVALVGSCLHFKLPPILGYLAIGVMLGPYGFAVVSDTDHTRALAEFGVVFLLFTIGLEFSLSNLVHMRGAVLGLGGAQVIGTTAIVTIIATYMGMNLESALVLGGIVAMSSTALVIKQLTDQVELHTRHGRNAVGILLFQDLMVIPFLILVSTPAVINGDGAVYTVLVAFVQGVLALGLIFVVGRWVLQPAFHLVARYKSMELFTLAALMIALGAAWITHQLGLSLALGAFVAGMMLGETEFRHQIEAEIRPFRDILLGLFFITIGMLFNIRLLPEIWPWVLLTLTALIIFKMLFIILICRVAHWDMAVSLRTGLVLAHGGEFGFAILTLALAGGMIPNEYGQVILAALLISMGLAPLIIRYNGRLAVRLMPQQAGDSKQTIKERVADTAHDLNNHIILSGYGRIGQNIAQMLKEEGFEYVALDLDPVLVQNAVKAKEPVSYGDSSSLELLQAAGLDRAAALVISVEDPATALKVLQQVRRSNTDIPVLVRTADESHLQELMEAGATEVVPETLEVSLMMASNLLFMLKVPPSRVIHKIRDVRNQRYESFRHLFPGGEVSSTSWVDDEAHMRAVDLNEESWASNHRVGELDLERYNVKLLALLHEGKRISRPDKDIQVCASDTLILSGSPSALEQAEKSLISR